MKHVGFLTAVKRTDQAGVGRRRLLLGTAGLMTSGIFGAPLPAVAASVKAEVTLHDVGLVDAISGRRVRLLSDIMEDRVVALNFMFTDCSTTCPMQSVALSKAQASLQREFAKRAVFVSVSLDPARDSVERLKRFAAHHGAMPGWHFLTGDLATIDRIRKGFGVESPRRDEHPPVISIGRAGQTRWSRLYGMPGPKAIVQEVRAWLD